MLLLGLDIGTSSVKASVIDPASGTTLATAQYPDTETPVISTQPGYAEQSPMQWWHDVQQAIGKANASGRYDPKDIAAIGIAYQMHGLVLVDKQQQVLRNSIIWCDSRAVAIGNKAFEVIGKEKSLSHLLNSPGNFTASKLAWVKENEPSIYEQVYKLMLPGDFIAMQLTGDITTTIPALSEGIFWDFKNNTLSDDVFNYFGFDKSFVPETRPVFAPHGYLSNTVAALLGLTPGIPVTYKAGDQPNNALSLNVLQPGEVAATAGTSGVIYAVTDQLAYDKDSRINSFAHVNNKNEQQRIGVLLNVNGCGSMNRWIKSMAGNGISYREMNEAAAGIAPGSNGLQVIPFGNGAERMLHNLVIGSHITGLDLNIHSPSHLYRATQEGIAYSLRYGLDMMKENGIVPTVIRAGHTNMFLSDVFAQAFVDTTGIPVELYASDGSTGAAIGAGIGLGVLDEKNAFVNNRPLKTIIPRQPEQYEELYQQWKDILHKFLENVND